MTTLAERTATSCAALRAAHQEPLHATAPPRAASWLLVEHPGPWPSTGLPADLPPQLAEALDAALELDVRPQLIRPVRERPPHRTTVVLASCRPDDRWAERRVLDDPRDLAGLDLAALAAGRRPGFGTPPELPVVLVCTHGRRDVCCARLGRPVARLLDRQLPGQVWETTHVGGDRFAANVVSLPDGAYHGGLTAADVPALVRALRTGEVLVPRLRGRAGLPPAVQAADHYARTSLGLVAVDAVRPGHVEPVSDGVTAVVLDTSAGRVRVEVRARRAADERLTSCAGDGTTGRPTTFELVALTHVL